MDDTLSSGMMLAISIIVVAVVLSVMLFVNAIGDNMRRAAVDEAYDALLGQAENDIVSINNYDKSMPVASLISFIDRYDGIIDSVRTIGSINFDAYGQLMVPAGHTTDAFGEINASTIFSTLHVGGIPNNASAPGAIIDTSKSPVIRGMDKLIGQKVYAYIQRKDTGNFCVYISDKTG